jgi:hypothetical protein
MKASDLTIETVLREDEWRENVPADVLRNGFPANPIPVRSSGTRAYLRRLRAAEMAAWELTGGDYLLPHCATRVGS